MKRKPKPRNGDRRTTETGPPEKWKERRVSVEKRMPEVKETSFDEWEAAMKNSSDTPEEDETWSNAVSKTLKK